MTTLPTTYSSSWSFLFQPIIRNENNKEKKIMKCLFRTWTPPWSCTIWWQWCPSFNYYFDTTIINSIIKFFCLLLFPFLFFVLGKLGEVSLCIVDMHSFPLGIAPHKPWIALYQVYQFRCIISYMSNVSPFGGKKKLE